MTLRRWHIRSLRQWRGLGAAIALTLSIALAAPVTAFACAAGGAGVAGGGQANSLGSFDFRSVTFVALGGFLLLAAQLTIPLAVTMRRRRLALTSTSPLSPDGRYWWDGRVWRPLPPPG